MTLFCLLQSLTTPTTEQAVRTAVDVEASKWYAPFVGALVAAGVGLIAGVAALVMAWLAKAKTQLAAAEAKAEVELIKAKAEAAVAEAKVKADAATAASLQNSERITTTSRAVNDLQSTVALIAMQVPPTLPSPSVEPPKGPQ